MYCRDSVVGTCGPYGNVPGICPGSGSHFGFCSGVWFMVFDLPFN